MRTFFNHIEIENPKELIFGKSKKPLKYGFNLEVGAGKVIPEIKYFPKPEHLKTSEKTSETYKKIAEDLLFHASNLGISEFQLELELPAQLTKDIKLGSDVTHVQKEVMEKYYNEYGIKTALRVTVADIRNVTKEDLRGDTLDLMLESFESVAENGADAVCIESYGGKEIIVNAATRGDILGVIFGTGVLASIDVYYLWKRIVEAVKNKAIPTGDTACSHANSVMVLAGGFRKKFISHTFAAVVRAISAVRTLASYEAGGIGPGKDCAYENTIIKAVTGYPVSMEGKTAACAHSSLIGNIPMAVADLWSNESVEYTRLYSGMAPNVFLEILYYDTEILNTALQENKEKLLQELIVKSNAYKDPQALILSPENSIRIGKALVEGNSYYQRALNAGIEAVEIIEENKERLKLPLIEKKYITKIKKDLENAPDEHSFMEQMTKKYIRVTKEFNPKNYG